MCLVLSDHLGSFCGNQNVRLKFLNQNGCQSVQITFRPSGGLSIQWGLVRPAFPWHQQQQQQHGSVRVMGRERTRTPFPFFSIQRCEITDQLAHITAFRLCFDFYAPYTNIKTSA